MTESEAYKTIERWLLVPVDYEQILPSMAAIRSASDFEYYAEKVAQIEYKTRAEVIRHVDDWIEIHKNDRTRDEVLAEKLDAIAGRNSNSSEASQKAPNNADLNAHFGNFVQDYAQNDKRNRPKEKIYPLEKSCPNCGKAMIKKQEYGNLTSGGIVAMIILFLVLGVFCVIPYILGFGRERKEVYYCEHCRTKRNCE